MEDYRLEQQKNTAAQLLLRAPLLNLYAYKQSLAPAIARFRLLQVISQSPDEADPTLGSLTDKHPLEQPDGQVRIVNQLHPEPQPAPQHAAAEPEQGPQPPRPAPDEDQELPILYNSNSDSIASSRSDSESDWPSDLEGAHDSRRAGAVAAERNLHPAQAQQQQQQHVDQQPQQQQEQHHRVAEGDDPRGQAGWATADDEILQDED